MAIHGSMRVTKNSHCHLYKKLHNSPKQANIKPCVHWLTWSHTSILHKGIFRSSRGTRVVVEVRDISRDGALPLPLAVASHYVEGGGAVAQVGVGVFWVGWVCLELRERDSRAGFAVPTSKVSLVNVKHVALVTGQGLGLTFTYGKGRLHVWSCDMRQNVRTWQSD